MKRINVCLSPKLYTSGLQNNNAVAVIDVLRATSAMCAAFDKGVKGILPVTELEPFSDLKKKGYLFVGERDGLKLPDCDYGNSPFAFSSGNAAGKYLVYSTTNGTQAISLAKENNHLLIASFSNISKVVKHFTELQKDVLLFCSGWKNAFSLEDTLCAGAIALQLIENGNFTLADDAAFAAVELWRALQPQLPEVVLASEHGRRLVKLGLENDVRHCLKPDTSTALPVWNGEMLVDNEG